MRTGLITVRYLGRRGSLLHFLCLESIHHGLLIHKDTLPEPYSQPTIVCSCSSHGFHTPYHMVSYLVHNETYVLDSSSYRLGTILVRTTHLLRT